MNPETKQEELKTLITADQVLELTKQWIKENGLPKPKRIELIDSPKDVCKWIFENSFCLQLRKKEGESITKDLQCWRSRKLVVISWDDESDEALKEWSGVEENRCPMDEVGYSFYSKTRFYAPGWWFAFGWIGDIGQPIAAIQSLEPFQVLFNFKYRAYAVGDRWFWEALEYEGEDYYSDRSYSSKSQALLAARKFVNRHSRAKQGAFLAAV